MSRQGTRGVGLLHYSAPPVIGGVESVLFTHARLFMASGYAVTILAGRGEAQALPPRTDLIRIPELDSQHPQVLKISQELEQGRLPAGFDRLAERLAEKLAPPLESLDMLFVHNVFTKHFNLPLTAALFRLLDGSRIRRCIAWCHDITWTSPGSRSKVQPGYPWDLLRTRRRDVGYVTISRERQRELADLFGCPAEEIRVIHNGVDPGELLGLSEAGLALIGRLGLWESDLNLLLPVRVTQAKNIELAIGVTAALKKNGVRPRLVVSGPPDPHDALSMEYFHSLLTRRARAGVDSEVRFVYESGPRAARPFVVDMPVVAELYRVSDALFLPSHREGFGMPVLEAGLAGIPVFCSTEVPAGTEIGGQDVMRFSPDAGPEEVAGLILRWIESSPVFNMRQRIRQGLTWQSLFQRQILPLTEQT